MPNYESYRVPSEGELWYSSTTGRYYIANEAGRLMPFQFDLSRNYPRDLLQDIRRIGLINGLTISGVCEGQAGWVFVSDNWLKCVKQTVLKTIEDMSNTLKQCTACVVGIK